MNYKLHYDRIIDRAKVRNMNSYSERHHIIPKCMGGTNDKSNLVKLTPEEHFVAHQLLIKIYPSSPGLIKAAHMMTVNSKNHKRNNKLYGWLKRELAKVTSKSQTGMGNSQYGRGWICCQETGEVRRIQLPSDIPVGWHTGKTRCSLCEVCGLSTNTRNNKFCKEHKTTNCVLTNPEIRKIALANAQTKDAKGRRKLSQKKNNHQSGINNSQFYTCWVTNGSIVKKIRKDEISKLEPEWVLGRNISPSFNE